MTTPPKIVPKGIGFKFLAPDCCTHYSGQPFAYPVPGPGEKWGPWFEHPAPAEPDGQACGPGRLHIMLGFNTKYAPSTWYPWWAQWSGEIGKDKEKVSVRWCRLRRITQQTLWRSLRPPFNWGRSAVLRGADLRSAVLRGADLRYADLSGAIANKYTKWPPGFKVPQDMIAKEN
jgi:hypothetical protein